MSTYSAIKTSAVAGLGTSSAAARQFAYPTVRSVGLPTPHPSTDAWPAQGSREPTPVEQLHGRRRVRAPRRAHLVTTSRPGRSGREGDAAERFTTLQERMATVGAATAARGERSLVVLPSRIIDKSDEPASQTQAYEERLLCTLFGLADPNVRMMYVTSSPVEPSIVDYYLSLLPRRIRRDARSRVTLVAVNEQSARPLSEKLLDKPRLLERLRRTIDGWPTCHLVPYSTTNIERDLALELDIPMYGADPCHSHLGSKSGCRALFAQAGVPHPVGVEDVTSVEAAIMAIGQLRASKPGLTRLVMKCNEGVAGRGNAILDLAGMPEPGSPDEQAQIAARIWTVAPEDDGLTASAFLSRLEQHGGVIEEWITADEIASPSVQLEITPSAEVRLLSTHDQILGGQSGQTYLGCRFPASPSYAPTISELGRRVGDHLADAGVIGRFAIDFIVARDGSGAWRPFAIELNLRKGGTTHPYETLARLTGGSYDAESALFTTPTGVNKYYVATDHLDDQRLRELGFLGVLGVARRPELRFDRLRRVGPVFHMLSSIDQLGRAGYTAIADSAEQADALYAQVRQTLIDEACDRLSPIAPARTPITARAAA